MGDLTPKVIEASDTTIYERGSGKNREVTRVRYMLGELGPFTAEFERGKFTESDLQIEIDNRRRALERHT